MSKAKVQPYMEAVPSILYPTQSLSKPRDGHVENTLPSQPDEQLAENSGGSDGRATSQGGQLCILQGTCTMVCACFVSNEVDDAHDCEHEYLKVKERKSPSHLCIHYSCIYIYMCDTESLNVARHARILNWALDGSANGQQDGCVDVRCLLCFHAAKTWSGPQSGRGLPAKAAGAGVIQELPLETVEEHPGAEHCPGLHARKAEYSDYAPTCCRQNRTQA